MRVVLQRVTSAKVVVDQNTVGQIRHGLLVLIGIAKGDTTRRKPLNFESLKTTTLK